MVEYTLPAHTLEQMQENARKDQEEALKELSAGAEGPVDVADHGPGPEFRNLSSADVADHGPQLTAAELKVADALVDSLRAKGTNKISYEEIEKALLKAEAEERGETEKDKSPEHHRLHNWNSRTPESADYCDDKTMTALRATQVLWAHDHPDTKLLLERKLQALTAEAGLGIEDALQGFQLFALDLGNEFAHGKLVRLNGQVSLAIAGLDDVTRGQPTVIGRHALGEAETGQQAKCEDMRQARLQCRPPGCQGA